VASAFQFAKDLMHERPQRAVISQDSFINIKKDPHLMWIRS
jgi:hypothetical protein